MRRRRRRQQAASRLAPWALRAALEVRTSLENLLIRHQPPVHRVGSRLASRLISLLRVAFLSVSLGRSKTHR